MRGDTVIYKKVLAGVLVTLQQQAFNYLQLLESGKYSHDQVLAILQFVQKQLFCKNPEVKNLEDSELAVYLKKKLNRPMRVCGMVKNLGEPGGGPFLAYNPDGTISEQILESSQIDMSDPEKKAMFEKGTHFNPVDLVCAIKDFQGNKFDLPKYVDKTTGFISSKSKNGKELKALELPGLWNGAMSNWNTVFVEVPLSTFNPVDLVCAVKDFEGRPFDLPKYVDKTTGFISSKSKNGKELKALELPGLWNGAMSNWNTVFVEVPLATFNPVKTVNDLLREQHQ
jgi:hypothetical protein